LDSKPNEASAGLSDRTKTVLIVDDDRFIVKLFTINLTGKGYRVLSAYNGKEGLEVISRDEPDIVILDIMMPVMNGLEMLEELRKTSEIPVIIVSGYGEPEYVDKARILGIECFINKPFEMEDLVNTLSIILQIETEPEDSSEQNSRSLINL